LAQLFRELFIHDPHSRRVPDVSSEVFRQPDVQVPKKISHSDKPEIWPQYLALNYEVVDLWIIFEIANAIFWGHVYAD
jgi:hypothetical protein